jgi:hypothetical protein
MCVIFYSSYAFNLSVSFSRLNEPNPINAAIAKKGKVNPNAAIISTTPMEVVKNIPTPVKITALKAATNPIAKGIEIATLNRTTGTYIDRNEDKFFLSLYPNAFIIAARFLESFMINKEINKTINIAIKVITPKTVYSICEIVLDKFENTKAVESLSEAPDTIETYDVVPVID